MTDKKEKINKQSTLSIFFEELGKNNLFITIMAIVTALIVGGLFVSITTVEMYEAIGNGQILEGLRLGLDAATKSFLALFEGAIGEPAKIMAALRGGDALEIRRAFRPITESLVLSVPYIYAGLAVALGFRSGLFNIGAEGQLFIGALFAVTVGLKVTGLPAYLHIPLAMGAGALGGAIWGFIPGLLKAKTGANEVINTIMMNYVAFRVSEYFLRGVLSSGGLPKTDIILETAWLPLFFETPIRFHLGFFLALGFAWLVWWFLFKTKWGFELRTVGANPNAARYAGMNITRNIILAMSLSGALAGLAGANEVLGVNHNLAVAFSSGYGFDAIALALLGGSHPLGVVLASLLFGALTNGGAKMQLYGIPLDIITVIQALVIAFIAAPAIVRTIYRIKEPKENEVSA